MSLKDFNAVIDRRYGDIDRLLTLSVIGVMVSLIDFNSAIDRRYGDIDRLTLSLIDVTLPLIYATESLQDNTV